MATMVPRFDQVGQPDKASSDAAAQPDKSDQGSGGAGWVERLVEGLRLGLLEVVVTVALVGLGAALIWVGLWQITARPRAAALRAVKTAGDLVPG